MPKNTGPKQEPGTVQRLMMFFAEAIRFLKDKWQIYRQKATLLLAFMIALLIYGIYSCLKIFTTAIWLYGIFRALNALAKHYQAIEGHSNATGFWSSNYERIKRAIISIKHAIYDTTSAFYIAHAIVSTLLLTTYLINPVLWLSLMWPVTLFAAYHAYHMGCALNAKLDADAMPSWPWLQNILAKLPSPSRHAFSFAQWSFITCSLIRIGAFTCQLLAPGFISLPITWIIYISNNAITLASMSLILSDLIKRSLSSIQKLDTWVQSLFTTAIENKEVEPYVASLAKAFLPPQPQSPDACSQEPEALMTTQQAASSLWTKFLHTLPSWS